MKKIIFLLIAVVALSVTAVSETKAEFNVGIRLGFNASKFVGTNLPYKFAPGFHLGPYFRVGIKEKYRISADLLFSTKGAVAKTEIAGETYTNYFIPFYIDVPILFNYKPVAGLYIEAGVQPSFALTTLNANSFSDQTEFQSNEDAGIKTLDFAPIVGLGYEFKKVSLGLRGAYGVTNVSRFSFTAPKNLSLMATFGFKI